MIRQRNQDAAQADAMPFLALTFWAASILWHLGASLVSRVDKIIDGNSGDK